jgi:hypothetical protein
MILPKKDPPADIQRMAADKYAPAEWKMAS